MDFPLLLLGIAAYLAVGVLLLIRAWLSPNRKSFPMGSAVEPFFIILWPVCPHIWLFWRRRRPRPKREIQAPAKGPKRPALHQREDGENMMPS